MVTALPLFGFLAVVVGVFWQFIARNTVENVLGLGRSITKRGNTNCEKLKEFEACEGEWKQSKIQSMNVSSKS